MSVTLQRPYNNVQPSDRFHWTVEAFYRAIAGDVFDEPKQWELVNGDLWKKEPVNPPHASLQRLIARLFRRHLEPHFFVLQESPLHLASDSEPIPDVYVARGKEEDFLERHPTAKDVALIIEVTDTSVQRDTIEKVLLYAQAGIADYWVSLISSRELLVFRHPSEDGYLETMRLKEEDTIRPLCAPEMEFAVRDLIVRSPNVA